MKIELVEGCICNSLTIDGVEEVNLTDDQRRAVLKELGDKLPTSALNNLLQEIMPCIGDYEFLGECEECGDTIDKYSLVL